MIVLIVALVVLAAGGSTLATLKNLKASAFFGWILTVGLAGVGISSLSDDPFAAEFSGYAWLLLLVLLGLAPLVGWLGVARPGSWWYENRYSDGEKSGAHVKYEKWLRG